MSLESQERIRLGRSSCSGAASMSCSSTISTKLTGQSGLLSVLENLFEHAGKLGHEVCFAFEADARGTALATADVVHGQESDGSPLVLRWVPEAELKNGLRPTWPQALTSLVQGVR